MKENGRVELQLYSFLISAFDTGKWLFNVFHTVVLNE